MILDLCRDRRALGSDIRQGSAGGRRWPSDSAVDLSKNADQRSDDDALELIEGDVVAGAVLEHGGSGALMGGDLARMLELAAIGEIGGNPGCPEGMAGEGRGEAGLDGPALAVLAGETGCVDIGVDKLLRFVMRRDLMILAAFFMEAVPGALADLVIVLDIHAGDRPDPGKAVDHHPGQRPISEAGDAIAWDSFQEQARLVRLKNRGLAALHHMLRPAHCSGRVHRQDLPNHHPIEQHADRSKVELDARRRQPLADGFDVGGDENGLDLVETDLATVAPGAEIRHGTAIAIGPPGIGITDIGGEELEKPFFRALAGGDQRRHRQAGRGGV